MVNANPQHLQTRTDAGVSETPAESRLWKWKCLQGSQLGDKKFRRQHSVGSYILDFYCPACKLAVELDGSDHLHSWTAEKDAKRTEFLSSLEIRVLRFENRWVFENLQAVLDEIRQHLLTAPGPS